MVIGLACKAHGNGPEGRLDGTLSHPVSQLVPKVSVLVGFTANLKESFPRLVREGFPFFTVNVPLGQESVLRCEKGGFGSESQPLFHEVATLNLSSLVSAVQLVNLPLCGFVGFLVGLHTCELVVRLGFCYASQSFFKPYGHNFE